ncbi:MAG: nucleoside deaminase, partial [Bdellovibrionales bacterium]|nr:nucleoside deaminase [Bdellovibrionales bacterium]
ENPELWMKQAYALAEEAASLYGEVPVAALLVRGDQIVGRGTNERLRSERTASHAEIVALEDYNLRFGRWRCEPGTSLVVTTEPCLMCTGALLWARVDHLYFGCEDPRGAGLLRIQPLISEGVYDHRFCSIHGGVLGEECSAMMRSFFSRMRARKEYESDIHFF